MLPCLLPEMLQVIDSISWTYPQRGFLQVYDSKSSKAMIRQIVKVLLMETLEDISPAATHYDLLTET